MAEKVSKYSEQSGKKTLVFVIVLLVLAGVFAFTAIYLMYKQSTVLIR